MVVYLTFTFVLKPSAELSGKRDAVELPWAADSRQQAAGSRQNAEVGGRKSESRGLGLKA